MYTFQSIEIFQKNRRATIATTLNATINSCCLPVIVVSDVLCPRVKIDLAHGYRRVS